MRSEVIALCRVEGLAPSPDKVAVVELAKSDLEENITGVSGITELVANNVVALHTLLLNGAEHGALIQAAMVHLQFETIHPFGDGNGRISRPLIHSALQRRGLTPSPVLPVSIILGTWSDRYIEGLTSFRASDDGLSVWLDTFIEAATIAVDQATMLCSDIADLRKNLAARVDEQRSAAGKTRALRADAAESRIMALLPDAPVLTASTAANELAISESAGRLALEKLTEAGILRRRSIGKRVTGYIADELLDLVTIAERQLASTCHRSREA